MTNNWRIPYSEPYLTSKTREYLLEAFDNSELSGNGKATQDLERRLSRLLNSPFGLTTSSGSASIRLALMTLGLRTGMRIILPGWGFHVASNIAFTMGARVEFRDVDLDTWCMNLDGIAEDIDEDEDLIIVLVHTLGNSSQLDKLDKIKAYPNVRIIEDAAEAMFSKYKGFSLGTIFDFGTYSFHAAKTITTGEGGFVTPMSEKSNEKARILRNHGMTPDRPYFHHFPGDNLRLSSLLASIALSQLDDLTEILQKRKDIYEYFEAEINSEKTTFLIPTDAQGFFPWGIGIKLPNQRDLVASSLREIGVDTRPGFSSASSLPYFGGREKIEQLPNSDLLAKEVLLLPHYPSLSDESTYEISQTIKRLCH
jgi:perosamine synthetase